jgi:hypothetical protein
MRHQRWYVFVVGILFVVGAAACGNDTGSTAGGSPTPTASPSDTSSTSASASATATPTVTVKGSNGDSLVKQVTGSDIESSALPDPTVDKSAATEQYVSATTQQAVNYWAADWCHYYTSNGVQYGDVCVKSAVDGQGRAVANTYLIYRYNPSAAGHAGELLRYLFVGSPNWVIYHDFNNAIFDQVIYAAYPASAQTVTPDNTIYYMTTSDGRTMWHKATEVVFTVPGSSIQQGRVPAYDPSITVQSYSLYAQINKNLRQIPGSSY